MELEYEPKHDSSGQVIMDTEFFLHHDLKLAQHLINPKVKLSELPTLTRREDKIGYSAYEDNPVVSKHGNYYTELEKQKLK